MLPLPSELGLSDEVVVAIPESGLGVYRLIRGAKPRREDFLATRPEKARQRGLPEILRLGYSAYLTREAAERVRRFPESRIAIVTLPQSPLVHVARTLGSPDHVTVWAPPQVSLDNADLSEETSS